MQLHDATAPHACKRSNHGVICGASQLGPAVPCGQPTISTLQSTSSTNRHTTPDCNSALQWHKHETHLLPVEFKHAAKLEQRSKQFMQHLMQDNKLHIVDRLCSTVSGTLVRRLILLQVSFFLQPFRLIEPVDASRLTGNIQKLCLGCTTFQAHSECSLSLLNGGGMGAHQERAAMISIRE